MDIVGYAVMGFFIALGTETSKVVHEWWVRPWLENRKARIESHIRDIGKIGNGGI